MMNRRLWVNLSLATALCAIYFVAEARDWPQWRGPRRDGVVPSFKPPARWPVNLMRQWEVKIGEGYSSPVVAGARIFLHSRQGEQEVVSALDLKNGKTVWSDRYAAPSGKKREYAKSEGEGPYSTPIVEGDRLYTLGVNAVLSCYNARSGKLKWRQDYSRELAAKTRFCGTAMSPLIEGDMIVIYVGDDDKGRLIALDKKTGRERWSWADAGAAYASPVVAELEGERQLVVMTDQAVAVLAPDTGKPLWTLPVRSSRVGCSENTPTPVVDRGVIILSHGRGTEALKPVKADGQWQVEPVWNGARLKMGLSSPVTDGVDLYGLSTQRKGQYFRLDVRTGGIIWTSAGREGDIAATQLAGDFVFFLSGEGVLTIVKRGAAKFKPVARYTVADGKVWSQPVLLDNRILVRAVSTLTLWSFE